MHSLSLFRSRPLLRVCSPSQWSRFFTSVSRPTPSPVGVAPIAIHQSMTTDPFFNLAYEAELFSSFQQQLEENPSGGIKHLLYVWCNGPSVIIGKHQNPYKECHLQKLEEQGVKLVRRHSGGGAVYQDLGNAIFSFISRDTPEAKEENNQIVLDALKHLNIDAVASGRNDIILKDDGRKVSGCAFKRDRGFLLHHATMLVNVDMTVLPTLLNPSKAKLQAKGVSSVTARVANLSEINPTVQRFIWEESLIDAFCRHHQQDRNKIKIKHVDADPYIAHEPSFVFKQTYTSLKSWDWRFGTSPSFSHEFSTRFNWGSFDVGFTIGNKAKVENVKVFSDALFPALVEILEKNLKTHVTTYSREQVVSALNKAEEEATNANITPDAAAYVREFRDWLAAQIH